ncbi:expressed unknown protein [Seminavis robusta]|uniref:Uncharacterized protein n=1 Tax=Seminavis robusta TaxID=568900 RepID=A0A9N8HY00_9STRA|nr:expressed unknown protein [Seminavis robusta]|eukprot:Sro2643_g333510.1 n/a (669) ;mRNA; f:8132-10138
MSSGITVSQFTFTRNDDSNLVPMKEIVCVNIFDPMSKYPPFEDRLPDLLPQRSNLYVTFKHGGKYWGKSIPFAGGDDAWVNIPLLANATGLQEPVLCEVKLPMVFSQDRTLFTAKFLLGEGNDNDSFPDLFGEIKTVLRDPHGNDSGLRLNIRTFSSDWDPIHLGTKHVPPQMDSYFTTFLMFLNAQVKALNLGGANILTKPREPADKNLPTVSLLGGRVEIPKEDEFIPLSWKAKYVVPILNRLPATTRNNPIYNRPRSMNRLRLLLGDGVTTPYEGKWNRGMSDASMHRVHFSSMGMFYIQKDPSTNGYVSDLSYFNKLKYKDSYDSIGCKTFFDANGSITMIEDSDGTMYHPGHQYWEWAKLKSRSAVFTLASLEHVTSYHYTWSATPGLALRMFLPPSHPIRMAFSAHMFRTHYTSIKAVHSLLSEVGILGRILPFTYEDGLEKAYMDLLDNYTFVSYPEELEKQGVADCPFHVGATDGIALYRVMADYVSNLFDEVYGTEERLQADLAMKELYSFLKQKMPNLPSDFTMTNLKLVWGEVLFRVTGAHTSIGNSVAYAVDPMMLNFRLKKDEKGEVVGSDECIAGVAGITAITIPNEYPKLSQDWSQVLKDPKSKAYAQLRADLDDLGDLIDSRNKMAEEGGSEGRRFVNRDFHPKHTALSSFS